MFRVNYRLYLSLFVYRRSNDVYEVFMDEKILQRFIFEIKLYRNEPLCRVCISENMNDPQNESRRTKPAQGRGTNVETNPQMMMCGTRFWCPLTSPPGSICHHLGRFLWRKLILH